jgi:hypothetical protein
MLSPSYSRSVLIIVLLSSEILSSLHSIFSIKTIYEFIFALLHATYTAYDTLSDKICRAAKIIQFLVVQFFPSPTHCIPIRNECIVRSDKVSTLNVYTFVTARDKFPRPQKRRGIDTFLPVLIFMFQTGKRNAKVDTKIHF